VAFLGQSSIVRFLRLDPHPGEYLCQPSQYWLFCTDTQFQGDCRTLGPGEYARLPRDVDRRIASVRRVNDVYGALSSGARYFR
jgi:hypothetical protein